MKRMLLLLLGLVIWFSSFPVCAEVSFDTNDYTREELVEIMAKIHIALYDSCTDESNVLYDSDGIYVEYRGIDRKYSHNVINLFIRNNREEDIYFIFDNVLINRAKAESSLASFNVLSNSMYITQTQERFAVNIYELGEAYGIDRIETIDFSMYMRYGEKEESVKIHLDVDIPFSSIDLVTW